MNLHPDTRTDLLSLYLADEASPATRILIEEQIASDPDFARLVRESSRSAVSAARIETPLPPPSLEKAALETTRRLLRLRSWALGLAIFTTLLPFASHGDDQGIRFLLLRDAPLLGAISACCAALFWFRFFRLSRRLRVTGL